MSTAPEIAGQDVDDHVDAEIAVCLDVERPKSFFLFAGAGSGKTKSLVIAVRELLSRSQRYLALRNKRIGVITYTNAACDEIKARLEFNPLVAVSTIHSFVWELIQGFHSDIRRQLEKNLKEDIAELRELLAKGRPGTKTEIDRKNSLKAKTDRLAGLNVIRTFTYNPNGNNDTRDSLNHTEVIKIGAAFIQEKAVMQSILLNKFPVLLIDESQDTNRLLMDSLLHMQTIQKERFALGLFGDVMQRIYGDGKVDLGINLPADWAQPQKVMNHRCPKRIVTLINKIRENVDGRAQKTKPEQVDGHVRLFVASSKVDRASVERWAAEQMATVTGDALWSDHRANVKTLLLEHQMAAARMGFSGIMEALYPVDRFKTGLMDGSLPEMRLFSESVLPLVEAAKKDDRFRVAALVRSRSPLLAKANVASSGNDQRVQIQRAKSAVDEIMAIWSVTPEPTFREILHVVERTGLFSVPSGYEPILRRTAEETKIVESEKAQSAIEDSEQQSNEQVNALDNFLDTPFSEVAHYYNYISGKAQFATHQGVKGLEFPRVMVINDDSSARGFMFKYDKLFGALEATKKDREHEAAGTDSSISRTRRLFYVTCSRAENSLAVVTYSENPLAVKNSVLKFGWFDDTEIAIYDGPVN